MFDLKGKHEHVFLSILNKYIFLRDQYVIYGPVRIILTEDDMDLLGLY
jgi:hypothetical protein